MKVNGAVWFEHEKQQRRKSQGVIQSTKRLPLETVHLQMLNYQMTRDMILKKK